MFRVRFIGALLIVWWRSASSFTATTVRRASSHQRCSTALRASPPPGNNELNLITFDLDDTIFPIGPVVADANIAQLQTLLRFGYTGASNSEIIAASKQIRNELRDAGETTTYTNLRKKSIRREIERLLVGLDSGNSERVVHDSVIDAVFDAWLSERHASADRNLYPHATVALERIREQHPHAVIGAITNGRGNPLHMPLVASYFDFCISGEDEGVFPRRKPDKGIYEAAVNKYEEIRKESTIQHSDQSFNWLHVGDDLANDVGASAAVGAKAIWYAEAQDEPSELPSWSTATEEELQKRKQLDEMAKKHVSAKISSLEDLPAAILEVLN